MWDPSIHPPLPPFCNTRTRSIREYQGGWNIGSRGRCQQTSVGSKGRCPIVRSESKPAFGGNQKVNEHGTERIESEGYPKEEPRIFGESYFLSLLLGCSHLFLHSPRIFLTGLSAQLETCEIFYVRWTVHFRYNTDLEISVCIPEKCRVINEFILLFLVFLLIFLWRLLHLFKKYSIYLEYHRGVKIFGISYRFFA